MIKLNKQRISNKISRIIFDSSIFRIVFLIDLFFFSVAFCDLVARVIHVFLMIWGGVILINNYFIKGIYKKVCYNKILLFFIASCLVTILLHFKDNLLMNLLYIFTYLLCFFVFYGMFSEKDVKNIEKEMFVLLKILVSLTTVISFIGLVFAVVKIQMKVFDYYWLGIYENRLIGVYTNSNLLALFCVLAVIATHILIDSDEFKKRKNKKRFLVAYVCSVIINIISLVLSDSNGAFIFLLIYIIVILFYQLFNKQKEISMKIIIKNVAVILSVGFCIIAGSFEIRGICQDRIAILINDMHKLEESIYDNKIGVDKNVDQIDLDENQLINKKTKDKNNQDAENSIMDSVEIGRVLGENNYDGSSGRVTLIKQAIVMFKKNPVMGIGIANIPDYGDMYIKGGLKFPNFHNGYITILVAWGLVGFIIFFAFSLLIALRFSKALFKINDSQNTPFPKLFSFIVAYSIYSLVEITILSDITFTIFIFWTILGYASSYMIDYESKLI